MQAWPRMQALQAVLPKIRRALSLLLLGGTLGCELDEATLAEPQDIAVAEVYLNIGDRDDHLSAFFHWTLSTRSSRDLLGLDVKVVREDGLEVPLVPDDLSNCVIPDLEGEIEGVCYSPIFEIEGVFEPGTRVSLEVFFEDGSVLKGATQIPEDIQLIRPAVGERCALPPGKALEFVWNRSSGVWAYSAETEIRNLQDALAAQGVAVEEDSVALLGLAISESDTTIVFPKEFGIIERFDLEQDLALALQGGLPRGAIADVVVAALDQNYVNWVRGGNFNPSGLVRISSLRGSGVGVFASTVRRTVLILGEDPEYLPGDILPNCLSDGGS